jgi:hypothetical protein
VELVERLVYYSRVRSFFAKKWGVFFELEAPRISFN